MTDEEEDGTGEKGRNWSDCAGREGGPLLLLPSSKERKEKGCHACLLWRKIFSHSGGDRRRRRRFLPLSPAPFSLPLHLLPVIVATFGNAGKWRDWQKEKEEREERVSIVDDWCGIRRLNAERTRFLIGNSNPTCD